jgi:PTH1 family peptidyl-tRNA hydrolase
VWLVVGLGNPGREYASHRHNVGFMVVDEVASRLRADSMREKFSAQWTKADHAGEQLVFLEPQTFMNESGRSVQPAAAFFKIAPANVLVVHDELDLPFGEVRLKVGGGHAGHNGLRSIISHLGTPDFARLRVGIGRPPKGFRGEVADYVLAGFDGDERMRLGDIVKASVDAVLDVAERGLTPATNRLNTKDSAKATSQGQSKGAGPAAKSGSSQDTRASKPPMSEKTPARH